MLQIPREREKTYTLEQILKDAAFIVVLSSALGCVSPLLFFWSTSMVTWQTQGHPSEVLFKPETSPFMQPIHAQEVVQIQVITQMGPWMMNRTKGPKSAQEGHYFVWVATLILLNKLRNVS